MKKIIIPYILIFITALFFYNKKTSKGISALETPWYREKVIPVLCYHNIGKKNGTGLYKLSFKKFKAQMNWLKQEGYETISLMKFYKFIRGEKIRLPGKPILITFDDANKGVYKFARNILNSLNYRMVVFVYPTIVSRKKKTMTWAELKETARDGHEIQSHTYYHPRLDFMNYAQQKKQFRKSKEILEKKTGQRVQFLAYPYGSYNKFSKRALKDTGYLAAFTIFPGSNRRGMDPYFLNRYMVVNYHSLKDFQIRMKLESLPVSTVNPDLGSFLKPEQIISVTLPPSLKKSRFIVYSGRSFFLKNYRQHFSYNNDTGILQMPVTGIRKELLIISIRYEERKTVYLNNFLYSKSFR